MGGYILPIGLLCRQDAGITLPKAPPPPSPPQQPQPLHQQQQGLPSGPPVSVESGSVNGGPSPSNKSRPGHRPSGVGAKLAAPAAAAKQGHGQGQPQQQQQHKDEKQPQQLQRAQQQPQQQQPQEKQQQQPTSTTQGPLRKPGGSVPQQHSGPVGPGRVQQVSHLGLHGNRMPSSSTGTDDTRSPQRRSPDLAGPDSGSVSLHPWPLSYACLHFFFLLKRGVTLCLSCHAKKYVLSINSIIVKSVLRFVGFILVK